MKRLLGLCTRRWCWRAAIADVTLRAFDADGQPVSAPVEESWCGKHTAEAVAATAPVAHEIGFELDDGSTVTISREVP